MRLEEKIVVTQENGGSRIKRRHDQAQIPLDRLIATNILPEERRVALEVLRDQTNPRPLRQEIHDTIGRILAMPRATPGQTEDVYETLLMTGCAN